MPSKQKRVAEDPSEPIYFFGTREQPYGIFSQFTKCTFEDPKYPEVEFECAEQYMMYSKAQTFHSPDIAAQILTSTAPRTHKKLGRQIKDFSDAVWDTVKFGIVERGNYLKFSQNEKFKKVLLETGDRLLVEASAQDKIWGIGYNTGNAKKVSREKWGQNLLGKALMDVREKIRAEEAGEDEDEEFDGSGEQVTDEEANEEVDEEPESHPAIHDPSTKSKKRKHDSIAKDDIDEISKPTRTPSKKARINTATDVNKGLHQMFNKTKGKHEKDEQITEDDLLEMLTKKAVEDSMINGRG